MARIQACRLIRRYIPGLMVLAMAPALTVGQAASAAPTNSAAAPGGTAAALAHAFEAGRHVPGSAVAGIRPGSLHVGTASGTRWAMATFEPSRSAAQRMTASFQDGAATGVFAVRNGTWQLVRTGLYGCGAGLPASLRQAWNLARPASCTASPGPQRTAAAHALAGMSRARQASTAAGDSAASLGQTVASLALQQVGHAVTPTVTSFDGVDCDPYSSLVAGFSANSNGCGTDQGFSVRNENEAWCADFAKYIFEQAGITADMNTLNAGSVSFYDWGLEQGTTTPIDGGTPTVGDAIVFFGPGPITPTRFSDHVGLVTAVHPDGTIDMANGDFLGSSTVSVQYNTDLDLKTWPNEVFGQGEQWIVVHLPADATQQPAPAVSMSGPHTAVTGATGTFHASASVPGGTITEYYWTFGDGRSTNTLGPDVTHVFSEDGRYTVSVSVTTSFGTLTTHTMNVNVLGASSTVAAAPSDAVWFASTPVNEYMFQRSADGLAAETWDGGGWLRVAIPGQPSAGGTLAPLSYPDQAEDFATTPHVYFRSADGSLAQTFLTPTGWATQELPGQPAAGSAITATTNIAGDPEVFFVNSSGRLAESVLQAGSWATSTLSGAQDASPASLALADTANGVRIFSTGLGGRLTVTSPAGGAWRTTMLPGSQAPGTAIAAVTTPGGQARLVFRNRDGGLTDVTQNADGDWVAGNLPGAPAAGSALAATNYLLPATVPPPTSDGRPVGPNSPHPLGQEVFYLTASGQPAVTFADAKTWQTATLPGTATGLEGANAYQVAGIPSQVFLSGANGELVEETSSQPSGTWAPVNLPTKAATFADRVVLYAATQDDRTAALAAASEAGLPASQVTNSFATAWAHTLSGNYLVIAVGLAATDALFFNVCGWDNPSTDIAGSTPFGRVNGPVDHLPGADLFENAASATAATAAERAADLAFFAVHGTLPPGVTTVPAPSSPVFACSGSPT